MSALNDYVCPGCGRAGGLVSGKILGHEDEVYCTKCGAWRYPEDVTERVASD